MLCISTWYIIIDKRYRNGVRNCKARQDADCGSDHNPVLAYINIKLQKISSNRSTGMASHWNTELLKDDNIQQQFKELTNAELQNTTDVDEHEDLWMCIKSSILEAAEDTCGKQVPTKRRHWMTTDILDKMEERRLCKNDITETGQRKYRQLRQEIQRLCRRAKNEFTNNNCSEIEKLEATHNPLLHKKIKEMLPKKYTNTQSIKDKHGNLLQDPQDILERWAQYVEELYDDTRSSVDKSTVSHEVSTVIQKLTRNTATGSDNIPAEFLQSLGEKGIQD